MDNRILDIVSFWESQFPNYPFIYKADKIAKEANIPLQEAEQVLSLYQREYQIEV